MLGTLQTDKVSKKWPVPLKGMERAADGETESKGKLNWEIKREWGTRRRESLCKLHKEGPRSPFLASPSKKSAKMYSYHIGKVSTLNSQLIYCRAETKYSFFILSRKTMVLSMNDIHFNWPDKSLNWLSNIVANTKEIIVVMIFNVVSFHQFYL